MNTFLLTINLLGNGLATRNMALEQAHNACNGFTIVAGDNLDSQDYSVVVECIRDNVTVM